MQVSALFVEAVIYIFEVFFPVLLDGADFLFQAVNVGFGGIFGFVPGPNGLSLDVDVLYFLNNVLHCLTASNPMPPEVIRLMIRVDTCSVLNVVAASANSCIIIQ